jgi:dihydrofolate synthase/folylpolyglutamate synthase
MDHIDRLGETLGEIAKTKAGIIKPNSIVVSASQQPEALEQLKAKAAAVAEKFYEYGQDFEVTKLENDLLGQTISIRAIAGEYHDLKLPVHGSYQAENAALALAAVEAFIGGGEQRMIDDIYRAAFTDFSSPGRLQVISREPLVILDAAHNAHGAASLANAIKNSFGAPYAVAVVSVLSEKDARSLFAEIDDAFVEFVVTQSESPRAIAATELAELASAVLGSDRVHLQPKPHLALAEAIALLPENQPSAVVVTGSVTLVGQILKQQQIDLEHDA